MKWVAILTGRSFDYWGGAAGADAASAFAFRRGSRRASNAERGAALNSRDASELETRMLQLIESTAVAVPGLVRASEPVKQNAEMTFATMERNPNPALLYQFINQVKAYLALSESIPRPYPFPETRTGNSRNFTTIWSEFNSTSKRFCR